MLLCGVGAKVEVVLNTFRSLFDVLTVGAGVAPLTRILEAAATIASTPMVALLVQDGTFIRLVAVRGLNTSRRVGDKTSSPGLDRAFGPPNIVATRDELKAFPRPLGLPPWTWAANVPIPIPSSSSGFALVCADMRSNVPRAPDIIPRLTMLASIVADEINLLATLAAQEEQISSGKAAQLLGMSRMAFIALLGRRGIGYAEQSAEELRGEQAVLDRLGL